MGPSLDTTILLSPADLVFRQTPRRMDKVRESPLFYSKRHQRDPSARGAHPRFFSLCRFRVRLTDYTSLSRAQSCFYGAANRDVRKFPDPHSFGYPLDSINHFAFGAGPHTCGGNHFSPFRNESHLQFTGKNGEAIPYGRRNASLIMFSVSSLNQRLVERSLNLS